MDDRANRDRLVLVTGGLGFVGRAVVADLLADGFRVRVLTRGAASTPGVEVVRGDVTAAGSLRTAVRGVDAVCHLAGLPRVRQAGDDVLGVNAEGTRALLRALGEQDRRGAVPFVLASSAAVYGEAGGILTEEAAIAPANPYGESKVLAEQHVSDHAQRGTVAAASLRCFNVTGATRASPDSDTTRIINRALMVAAGRLEHLTINGDGGTLRDYVHVADVAAAFRLALESLLARPEPGNRCYNVGSGHPVSLLEIVEAAAAVTGRPVPVIHGPPGREARELVADPARAVRDLSWEPVRSHLGRMIHDTWHAPPLPRDQGIQPHPWPGGDLGTGRPCSWIP